VLVTVRIVQRGAVIEIDDGGVGMEEHEMERARDVASGRRLAGLADLGEIPQTGLAVVGHYARSHGFGVDLMPSPYGGVRAVVLVPAEMLETLEPPGSVNGDQPGRRRSPRPRTPEPDRDQAAQSSPAASAAAAAQINGDSPPGAPTPAEAGAWMGAYLGGGEARA
jgi:hypothetical protein